MKKKGWDTAALCIWIIVFLLWLGAFIFTKFYGNSVSLIEPPRERLEYINQRNQECKKLMDNLEFLDKDCNSKEDDWEFWKCALSVISDKQKVQEVFYSPKLDECVAIMNDYKIRWIASKSIDKYTHNNDDYHCRIYKNWEEYKKYELKTYDVYCKDRLDELFQKEVDKLRSWY